MQKESVVMFNTMSKLIHLYIIFMLCFPGVINVINFNSRIVIVKTVIVTDDISGFFKLVNHRFIDKNKNKTKTERFLGAFK